MKSQSKIKTEYIIKLYKNGYSLPEISEITGITNQAIWIRLKRNKVPRRSHIEAGKLAYKRGRNKPLTGANHHSWKGGRYKDEDGYIQINIGKNKRQYEHRLIWEKAYGKILKGYIIHHLNGIRDDNRLENLIMLPRKRHSPLIIIEPHQKRIRELEKQLQNLKGRLDNKKKEINYDTTCTKIHSGKRGH